MAARRVALLGAESTGKTRLANELATHLREQGCDAVAVPETLRAWCESAGRPPRPEEQLAIAQAQEAAVDAAAATAAIVIADGSALMVAIYAGMLQPEGELLRFALSRQRACDATLVTGLDLPWVPDGLQRSRAQDREPVDALLRELLQRAGVSFQVVYGSGPQRLHAALAALQAAGVLPASAARRPASERARRAWVWVCDKCSDPECEHRLFRGLR